MIRVNEHDASKVVLMYIQTHINTIFTPISDFWGLNAAEVFRTSKGSKKTLLFERTLGTVIKAD